MKKIRYGVIGAGGCGASKHLASYSLLSDDVDIIAVCDIRGERADQMADLYNAEASYTDYREMLKQENLDLVSVATPNHVHAPAAIAALRAGCHVHCEKPASLTPALVQSMVDAKNQAGKKLMIGLNNRFDNWAQLSKKWVDSGRLGEIYHLKCGWKRRRGIPGKGGWFTTKAQSGGGPLIDLGVHFIDVSNYLIGFPEPVSVSGQTYSKFAEQQAFNPKASGYTGTYDVEDLAVGMLRYANGCTMDIEFSWASNIDEEYTFVELYGDRGGLNYSKGKLTLIEDFNGTIMKNSPVLRPDENWGNVETRHFVDCIKNDQEVMAKPEEAVIVMKMISAIYESAAKGKEVKVKT